MIGLVHVPVTSYCRAKAFDSGSRSTNWARNVPSPRTGLSDADRERRGARVDLGQHDDRQLLRFLAQVQRAGHQDRPRLPRSCGSYRSSGRHGRPRHRRGSSRRRSPRRTGEPPSAARVRPIDCSDSSASRRAALPGVDLEEAAVVDLRADASRERRVVDAHRRAEPRHFAFEAGRFPRQRVRETDARQRVRRRRWRRCSNFSCMRRLGQPASVPTPRWRRASCPDS